MQKDADRLTELIGGIGLLEEVTTADEPAGHLRRQWPSGGVEHAQSGAQHKGLVGYIVAAKGQFAEPDIDEQRVDMERRGQVNQRLGQVAGDKGAVPQVFHRPFSVLANEKLVFDNEDNGHQSAINCNRGILEMSPA